MFPKVYPQTISGATLGTGEEEEACPTVVREPLGREARLRGRIVRWVTWDDLLDLVLVLVLISVLILILILILVLISRHSTEFSELSTRARRSRNLHRLILTPIANI